MKKSIIGIMMAVTLVGSSLAFPVQAYAREQGEVVGNGENVEEIVPGESVTHNHGTVETNYGTVTHNDIIGTVTNNNGTVTNNIGTVETNKGTVTYNDINGTVTNNNGTVTTNGGTVETNKGTVNSNTGTVETNHVQGTVKNNAGTVIINTGTVNSNTGTVETNNGTVKVNHGQKTVKNNFGTVETNQGTVENNFGGTVNGGTVTNQWYEYILTGGIFKSGSKQTTADDRTWIGKAESTDNKLGDYYITVAANEGAVFEYATVNGEQVSYITNEDGSISFGNISSAISIFFKQLTNNNNNNNNNNNDDENTSNTYESSADANDSVVSTNDANLVAAIEAVVATEEKMPVTSFTSDEAVAKIPEAAKNSGASYNLSVITSSQGFTAAVNKISETVKAQNAANNAGGRIASTTIYSEKPMLFTADVLNAISASDIDFVFVFMHNGKMYRVTIPRGAKIDFTGHVCEGPLYFGQILGTTEVIG